MYEQFLISVYIENTPCLMLFRLLQREPAELTSCIMTLAYFRALTLYSSPANNGRVYATPSAVPAALANDGRVYATPSAVPAALWQIMAEYMRLLAPSQQQIMAQQITPSHQLAIVSVHLLQVSRDALCKSAYRKLG